MNFRLRRPLDVISGHPRDVRLGHSRDVQIGSLRDVLRMLEGDVLGTSWGPNMPIYQDIFLLTVEIKDYDVTVYRQIIFNQPVKNDLRIYNNVPNIAIYQGDDHKTGCLLDYPYYKDNYK